MEVRKGIPHHAKGASQPHHMPRKILTFRRIGFPLFAKISLACLLVTLITTGLIFGSVTHTTVNTLNEEIDNKGIKLIQTLSSLDPNTWINMIQAKPAKPPFAGLEKDLGLKIIAVQQGANFVSNVDDQKMRSLITSPRTRARIYEPGPGQIECGDMPYESEAVRVFWKDVETPQGKLKFWVTFSKEHIAKTQQQIIMTILYLAGAAILIGIIIALLISSIITKPVKTLMNDINIVSSGNLAYQARITSTDEIGVLAQTFNKMTRLLKLAHENELTQISMQNELQIARQIQDNLLPKDHFRILGYDNHALYRASKEVSGDYYDFLQISDNLIGIVVADVSGKGVPASIVMSMTRAFLRMEATRNTSPVSTLIQVNKLLSRDMKKGMFVTACYMILDLSTHRLTIASAGHNPIVIWKAQSKSVELSNASGMALGFNSGPLFEHSLNEVKIQLARGDRIVAYTDGVTEQMDRSKHMFGMKKLCMGVQRLAAQNSELVIKGIVNYLDEHRNDEAQNDDITIVTFRRAQ